MEGINVLQDKLSRLAALRRAEHVRKKEEDTQICKDSIFRDPFKFIKGVMGFLLFGFLSPPFCFLSGRVSVQQRVWLAELLPNKEHLSFIPPSILP